MIFPAVYSSILDDKTPLYSNLGFLFFGNQLRQEICESGREGWIVFMDVDHLDEIRLQYGHATSVDVLHSVALAIREIFPAPAVAARSIADEFAVLLPAPEESEEVLLSRFNEALNKQVTGKQLPFSVTVASGIARSGIVDSFDLDELLRIAVSKAYSKKPHRKSRS